MYDTILYLATTKLDPNIIWASTDDGLVQLTRDASTGSAQVAHWQNVSPPATLVPPWGRIMGLEPGRFAAGTAFVAVERHLLGDEHPYILRTDDYGTTWRSIAGNLPPNQFVRAIRQDPRNANVLYAGTNRGVWVTFDGGAQWESLRLNMPATASTISRSSRPQTISWLHRTAAASGFSTILHRFNAGLPRNRRQFRLFSDCATPTGCGNGRRSIRLRIRRFQPTNSSGRIRRTARS